MGLPEEAVDFGVSVRSALAGLGGVDAARRAEADPGERAAPVAGVLAGLGVPGLDPREDEVSAAAAGELCREAGRVALPYPVASVLLAGGSGDDTPLAVVDGPVWRVDHADLFPVWRVTDIEGRVGTGRSRGRLGTRLGPFAGDLEPDGAESGEGPGAGGGAGGGGSGGGAGTTLDAAFHLTLTAWTILGGLESALQLAVEHVTGRVQFGQPISGFQAVQFQLADCAVGVDGLREAARFTLWRLLADPERAITDALALRLQAVETARAVLRTTQQLHGASGLCDEYDISILCRHLQPALRLPFGADRAAEALFDSIERHGFESLFPHGGAAGGAAAGAGVRP
ncbi:MAG TPA: acyl-CoA dehydrogenase family protein [Acidimicrobiales bacterium]|nr:acyl-CoA dehydrogenase family protein [Acidimicrobiales bacterium]